MDNLVDQDRLKTQFAYDAVERKFKRHYIFEPSRNGLRIYADEFEDEKEAEGFLQILGLLNKEGDSHRQFIDLQALEKTGMAFVSEKIEQKLGKLFIWH